MLHAVALLGDPEAGPYFWFYKLSIFVHGDPLSLRSATSKDME
jgi:hypothetical protein